MSEDLPGRRRIAVVTDDAAALPPEWVRPPGGGDAAAPRDGAALGAVEAAIRPGLAVVMMPVTVDGQSLVGDARQWPSAVARALGEDRAVSTSRPSPGQLLRVYRRLESEGFEGIVSIHCSRELSGTLGSAQIAAATTTVPVRIVDTRTIAMGEGFGVIAAWEVAGSGGDLEAVAEAAQEASAANPLLLWVPGLETLRRGGRIGPSVAALGGVLQVKPLLRVSHGQLAVVELPRTEARARQRFQRRAGRALAHTAAAEPELVIHYLDDAATARQIGAEIVATHRPDARLRCLRLPAVLAAHAGLGAVAAVVRG